MQVIVLNFYSGYDLTTCNQPVPQQETRIKM